MRCGFNSHNLSLTRELVPPFKCGETSIRSQCPTKAHRYYRLDGWHWQLGPTTDACIRKIDQERVQGVEATEEFELH